jgi:predicted enzyme related to lactoylglutathione lyase
MTKMNAVGWFDIYVDDMDRAVTFYETVLDTKLAEMGDPTGETQMMAFNGDMEVYGAAGALVKTEFAKPGPGGTQIYFSVQDCAVQQDRVAANGGQIIRPKFSIGDFGFISLAQDTEGNMIGFNSMQ